MAKKRYFFSIEPEQRRHVIAHGYRQHEIQEYLKARETKLQIKLAERVSFKEVVHVEQRAPVQVSLGCHVAGAALPHVDSDHGPTRVGGFKYRSGAKLPQIDIKLLRKFRIFVRRWIRKHMTPLDPETDFNLEYWLSRTHYPQWRKDELRKIYENMCGAYEMDDFHVDSFIKDETYPDWKTARVINARSDKTKVLVGPIFKAIEEQLFKMSYFIKKIPKTQRAKYIYEHLYDPVARYFCTDFSSFEASFVEELMEACEFELYDYMCQKVPESKFFKFFCHYVLGGINKMMFYDFIGFLHATRMSGEMNTSLGNGFSNLMVLLFIATESGYDPDIFACFVEGDDGICQTYVDRPMKIELFKSLGFDIKEEYHDKIGLSSFCGNLFDDQNFVVITDIYETVVSFGWTRSTYWKSKNSKKMSLLRSKALSLLYEYPGCPILQSLAQYGIRVTKKYRAYHGAVNEYQREQLTMMLEDMKKNGLPVRDIAMSTRLLVEELYGISPESQIAFEKYLDSLDSVCPIDISYFNDSLKSVWREYYLRYVREYGDKDLTRFPFFNDRPGPIYNKTFLRDVLKGFTT